MKKSIISLLVLCVSMIFVPVSFAQSRDFWQTSYGSWVYWSDIQNSNTQTQGYHEISIGIGDMSFPILNNDKFIVVEYQFNQPYSGSLGINYNYNVTPMFKFASGDIAYYDYTSSNTVYVGLNHCTYFYLVLVGSPSNFISGDIKVNSISYNITPDSDDNVVIDYSSKLNDIYNYLGYINNSVDNIESYTDDIEGYINSLEPTLENVKTLLTNIYNTSSTFQGQTLTNLNSINTYLSNINNKINSLDINVNSILSVVNSINSSLNTVLLSINKSLSYVPTYSLSAYRWFNGFYNDGIVYDTYNYPSIRVRTTGDGTGFDGNRRIQLKPSETLLLSFLCTQNITFENFPYYILDNKSGTVNYSYKRLGSTYYIINITVKNNNTSSLSISFDYIPNTSMNVVPLYLGDVQLMSDEIQMITQFYANNSPDYTNDIDHISQLLEDIGLDVSNLSIDNSTLVNAINNLNSSLSDLSSSINITNNIDISNIPPYSVNAYYWFGKFNNNGIVNDIFQYPNMYITNTVTGSYEGNRRLYVQAHRQLIIAVISSVSLTSSNFPYYFNDSNVSQYVSVSYSVKSFADRRYQYVVITNDSNSTITISFDYTGTGFRVVPFYIGYVDLMTDDLALITQYTLPSTNEPYYSVLNDIYESINNLDLNVSVDITNEQVQNVTNNFDTNIEIVNNVEVDFNTSFEDTNELITDTDLTLDFDGLLSGIDVYHSIFSHFYNYSFFKYICIVCLVGGVILVLLG